MTKLRGAEGGSDWKAICPGLKTACDEAFKQAYENHSMPHGVSWPSRYGNHVSARGTLRGCSACEVCNKRVDLTITLLRIDKVTDNFGGPTDTQVYDSLAGTLTYKIGGTDCKQFEKPFERF